MSVDQKCLGISKRQNGDVRRKWIKKHAQSARDTAPWERLPSMLEALSLMHSTAEDKRGKEGWGWQRQSGDRGAGGKY